MRKGQALRTAIVLAIASIVFVLLSIVFGIAGASPALARGAATPPPHNPYFSTRTVTRPDGTMLTAYRIGGPPRPPAGVERPVAAVVRPDRAAGVNILSVPAYGWTFGCSATSGAMIAAYYDRNSFPNIYTGPTDAGVMPMDSSVWPWLNDGYALYEQCPLAASHNGLDGRATRGSIDDYWLKYDSAAADPYIGNWTEHTWNDAIGDYMKTSQSAFDNPDGATTFWGYTNSSARLTCADLYNSGYWQSDGTYGRKLFYEARGYAVNNSTGCYAQVTNNIKAGGFSFANYKAEIDAGRPVMLNLAGHTIVGIGYDDTTNTVYLHDTWDYATHVFVWNSNPSYAGMQLQSVSIVSFTPGSVPPIPTSVAASDGTYSDKVNVTWSSSVGATSYEVYRADSLNGTQTKLGSPIFVSFDDTTAVPGQTYYYWVKACNLFGCSGLSSPPDTGYRAVCYALTKNVNPNGAGSVTANPSPNCPGDATKYVSGTQVTLTASASQGYYTFVNWSGDASGTSNQTTVTMDANKTVIASFNEVCYALTTSVNPSGSGTVTVTNPTIPDCVSQPGKYRAGTVVTLSASASGDYRFFNWSGDASGTNNSTMVAMTSDKSATANFTLRCYSLSTGVSPAGSGTVEANPAPNCATEQGKYTSGTVVTLNAAPSGVYLFASWSGDASGTTTSAQVTMTADKSVTAHFVLPCFTLATVSNPIGGGTIAVAPAPNCAGGKYEYGTPVQLTANAAAGYGLANWSGDASGSANPTTVTMTADRNVTANFTPLPCYTLTIGVNPAGSGGVEVGTQPNCLTDNAKYVAGTQVQLTAAPNGVYLFEHWSGDASGTINPTTVTMNGDRNVTANFVLPCFTLTTMVSPDASGTVAADPTPNCAGGKYTYGTQVQLTTTANPGYAFANWTGAATGPTNPVTIMIDGDKTVTANFSEVCYTLSKTADPTEGGTVNASAPTCVSQPGKYRAASVVTLDASANMGYSFASWSGDATGTANPTAVTMTSDKSVTANFSPLPCYTLTSLVSPAGSGAVRTHPAPNCATDPLKYASGTQVAVHAEADEDYVFANWSGDASGTTNPTSVTMTTDRSVTANMLAAVEDTSRRIQYSGWRGETLASSGESYRVSGVKNDKATFKFTSTSIIWLTRKGPDQGKAQVTIGTKRWTVDLYAPAYSFTGIQFSKLSAKPHTIVVKVTGAKNGSSGGTGVTLDGFTVGGATTQDSSPAIRYNNWIGMTDATPSSGSYRFSKTKNSLVSFTFTGSSINWITATGPKYGKALVTIGSYSEIVDLFSPTQTWGVVKPFSNLGDGTHTMQIKVLGVMNPKSRGTGIVVDAFTGPITLSAATNVPIAPGEQESMLTPNPVFEP